MTKKSTSEPKAERTSGRDQSWSGSFAYIVGRAAGVAGRQVDNLAANTARIFRGQRKVARKGRSRASHADPVAALIGPLVSVLRQHSAERSRRLATDPAFWDLIERLGALRPLKARTRHPERTVTAREGAPETTVTSRERGSDDVPPSGTRSAALGESDAGTAAGHAQAAESAGELIGNDAGTDLDEILLPTDSQSEAAPTADAEIPKDQPAAGASSSDTAKKPTGDAVGSGGSAGSAPVADPTTKGSAEKESGD
jgi:hypothetical protein